MNYNCPNCGHSFQITEKHLGKRATCSICEQSFLIEHPLDVRKSTPVEQKLDPLPAPGLGMLAFLRMLILIHSTIMGLGGVGALLFQDGDLGPVLFVMGITSCVGGFVLSELIHLAIYIERNTRAAADAARRK